MNFMCTRAAKLIEHVITC